MEQVINDIGRVVLEAIVGGLLLGTCQWITDHDMQQGLVEFIMCSVVLGGVSWLLGNRVLSLLIEIGQAA